MRIARARGSKGDGTILYRGVFQPCRDPVTHPLRSIGIRDYAVLESERRIGPFRRRAQSGYLAVERRGISSC